MGSPLPEDPYLALGVAKDATAGAIKTQYRKLVLKFHPDKVQEESQKQAAVDQFHKIQTAYEIIGDEERRQRYDAQCKLAELRKDVMERQGGGGRAAEVRTAAYKMPTDAPKGGAFYARGPERVEKVSPQYEERKPAYASAPAGDYFDTSSRVGSRKDAEYERSSKRTPARDERERVKVSAKESKENERTKQKERSRRTEKDIRREREYKTTVVEEEDSDSDTDEYERQARRWKEEDNLRRMRETYHDQARKDKEDATRGYYDSDERARKLYSQYDEARGYMDNSTRSRQRQESAERRPSPVRMSSTRDPLSYVRQAEGRPAAVRRGSERPKTAGREVEERRASERRSSAEVVDESRRQPPPPLMTSKSSPADIRPPLEKPRAQSVQIEKEDFAPPKMKRAETMPHVVSRDRDARRREPQKGSSLRQTEIVDGYATPAATPEVTVGPNASKYRYHQEYADDNEYPTPDGYRTELREPTGAAKARWTRSPSPIGERDSRDKARAASARFPAPSAQRPAPVPRTTSTSYVYKTPGQGVESLAPRPGVIRENTARDGRTLYGEVPTTRDREVRSPRQSAGRYPPPEEGVRYQDKIRPEDIRVQSGYGSRRPSVATRPSYSRSGSSAWVK